MSGENKANLGSPESAFSISPQSKLKVCVCFYFVWLVEGPAYTDSQTSDSVVINEWFPRSEYFRICAVATGFFLCFGRFCYTKVKVPAIKKLTQRGEARGLAPEVKRGVKGKCPAPSARCLMRNLVNKNLKRAEPPHGKSTQKARAPGRAKGYQIVSP